MISGSPTAPVQNKQFTVQITDAFNPAQTATKSLTLTITAQTPDSLAATGGTPQNAVVNTPYTTPLTVVVKDSSSAPVPGITVAFTAPGSGARATFAGGAATINMVTDASGIATAPALSANATTGTFNGGCVGYRCRLHGHLCSDEHARSGHGHRGECGLRSAHDDQHAVHPAAQGQGHRFVGQPDRRRHGQLCGSR